MDRDVRVVHVGLGPMGQSIARHILSERTGIRYVGAIDVDPALEGKDLGDVVGVGPAGVTVTGDAARVFEETRPDIAIYTTVSTLRAFLPQTEIAIRSGVNVISTCEELAYPSFIDAELSARYDEMCRNHGVTMLGTGINPGFLMDMRASVLTAACTDVQKVEVTRRMDATSRRQSFQKRIGAGMDVEEYRKTAASGEITGHVGLEISVYLIADALGWDLTEVRVTGPDPIVAERAVSSEYYDVAPGRVKGTHQEASGMVGEEERIKLCFTAFLGATPSFDEVVIVGTPEVRARVSPCWHGDYGTVAMAVNLIPAVINARPGLLTANDLVPVSFKSGNLGKFVAPRT